MSNCSVFKQWSNCKIYGRGTLWWAREREPIMGVWKRSPQQGPGAEPPSQGVRGEAPLKLKTILLLDTRQTCRACRFFSISQRSLWFSFWVTWNLPSELGARRSASKNGRATPLPRVPLNLTTVFKLRLKCWYARQITVSFRLKERWRWTLSPTALEGAIRGTENNNLSDEHIAHAGR